ncbi:hypothetical protein DFH06DRAFT_1330436 [Mycena polygramma]|nr:hypothetical protein DFH06DRAFT_1330436 [Mycena polygramma]
MFSQTLLTFAIASLAAVKAVDVCSYSNTLGCSGTSLCCKGVAEHICCEVPNAGFGFSIAYNGLPGPVSDGQAWTSSNCVDGGVFTDQVGTGNKCYVGAGTKINSSVAAARLAIAWTNTASKRATVGPMETMQVNVFKYTAEGVEKAIQIPAVDGAVDAVLNLYKAGNFTGLATYASAD